MLFVSLSLYLVQKETSPNTIASKRDSDWKSKTRLFYGAIRVGEFTFPQVAMPIYMYVSF